MKFLIWTVLFLFLSLAGLFEAAVLRSERKTGLGSTLSVKEPIDPDRRYHLGWQVEGDKILFEVEVATTGYVGFGISPNGGMTGADIFIAGVKSDKTEYSGDYHGTRNGMPEIDAQQDWDLLEASENATHTKLKFSRLLNTCDKLEDYPITGDTSRVIWSIGNTDDLSYHEVRGTVSTNFLIPDMPFEPEKFEYFDIMKNMTMPEEDTTYWCTIHKGPQLLTKHHIVAFEANLNSREAVDHTHHFILSICTAPEGRDADEFFGPYLNDPGNYCYLPQDQQTIPFAYCREFFFVWAKGGKRLVFPENVGFPIGENGQSQYYMMEIHYDNPAELKGVTFDTGVRTYYTPTLREEDAGLMVLGHKTTPSLLVPPETSDLIVTGHLSPECSKNYFPQDGIQVFNSLLHAHLSGRKLKLRHFRNGEELPWLDNDDAYDFNFQQNKPLQEFRKVLPSDQLTFECTYDSNWHEDHQAIPGGLTTRDEMCDAFIFYYPRVQIGDKYPSNFQSEYPTHLGLTELGIEKYHFVQDSGFETVVVDEPEHMRGSYVEAVSFKMNWTEGLKQEFQRKRRFGLQEFRCGQTVGTVSYPEVREEYVPIDQCDL